MYKRQVYPGYPDINTPSPQSVWMGDDGLERMSDFGAGSQWVVFGSLVRGELQNNFCCDCLVHEDTLNGCFDDGK